MTRTEPEDFVNLQGLLVQSSKWLGISSVQLSSLVTNLPETFVQFSAGHGTECLRSVRSAQFIQFISQTLPPLVPIDLAGSVRLRLGSVHRDRLVWEEHRSSSRSPPAEIPARRPGVCCLGGEIVRLLAVFACLSGVWSGVGVT